MKKINESFTCINCHQNITQADKTCRNHCPYCFVSLHVDWDIPWDRNTDCWWTMYPIDYQTKHWSIKILFQCSKCGKQHWNKRSLDDQVDQLNKLIEIYKPFFF